MANLDFIVFELEGGRYALDISVVKEVVELKPIMPVPETPDYVVGLINLRGEVLPVIDIKQRLRLTPLEPDEATKIIVVENTDYKAGLLVESLPRVHRAESEDINREPSTVKPKIEMEMVAGVLEEDYTVILNLDRVLQA